MDFSQEERKKGRFKHYSFKRHCPLYAGNPWLKHWIIRASRVMTLRQNNTFSSSLLLFFLCPPLNRHADMHRKTAERL